MINAVFIAGPTASGKTEYAIQLARALNGEIVSADSMQIYKYMDIGSAKPTKEERALAVHWLVDEIDPRTPFTAAEYKKLAEKYIDDIAARGKLPIICGGTGLYFNALIYDMDFSAPEGDDAYRQGVWESCGKDPAVLHERLKALDPHAAEVIHPNNVKRTLRAIERLEHGEDKLAEFSGVTKLNPKYNSILIGLDRDRDELYDRINRRVVKLYDAGLPKEIRTLMDMGFKSSDVAMKGIGYKEIIDAVSEGGCPEDAAETIKQNTRRYAKRQLTWFRRYPHINWVRLSGNDFDENAFSNMLDIIENGRIKE